MTWNEFLTKLTQEFAVPEDLLKLYNVSDIEREYDFQNFITEKDKKLIEIAGIEPDGQYEFDLELPCANGTDPTKIKLLSGRCSIIAHDRKLIELAKPGSEKKIVLDQTGFRRKPKGRKLKIVTSLTEEGHQYRKYIVEDLPNSRIDIEMNDEENPTVTLFLKDGTSRPIDFVVDDVLLHNTEAMGDMLKKRAASALGGVLHLFTVITNIA